MKYYPKTRPALQMYIFPNKNVIKNHKTELNC